MIGGLQPRRCGAYDASGGWCLKEAGHDSPHAFGGTPEDKAVTAAFGAALASAYPAPEPLTREAALAIVRGLPDDDRLDSRETEALEVLLGALDAEASGPYTRAQFAAAVDEAHAALYEAEQARAPGTWANMPQPWAGITVAHEALHRVGAGLERVDCATADPEAQRLLADLIEAGKRPLPCGHLVEDLISGRDPSTGRMLVTKCGACLAALPKREPVPSRSFLPQGCTSEQISTAAGVAARELVAEHGAPAGVLVEVRLVRRGGEHTGQTREQRDGLAGAIKATQTLIDTLRAKIESYDGGDRPMSPPVRLLRELREAEAVLRDLRGEA